MAGVRIVMPPVSGSGWPGSGLMGLGLSGEGPCWLSTAVNPACRARSHARLRPTTTTVSELSGIRMAATSGVSNPETANDNPTTL